MGAQRIRGAAGVHAQPGGGGIYLSRCGADRAYKRRGLWSVFWKSPCAGVASSIFGDAGEGYLRIACTVGLDKMEEAFGRMAQMPMLQGR